MESVSFSAKAKVPSVGEFAKRFPMYGPFAEGGGKFLFELITNPESHFRLRVATEDLGFPAVAGIARCCHEEALRRKVQWSGYLKQYIGAVVCMSMEANGFRKTGTKRTVPHPNFTKGEVYIRAS